MRADILHTKYAIETAIAQNGSREYRLVLAHRAGRGPIEDPSIVEMNGLYPGFVMRVTGKDGLIEQIGSETSPLPMELIDQAQSETGLTVINLDDEGRVIDGQVLWLESAERRRPHPSIA